MDPNLPVYLKSAKPNPETNRAPWYKNTAPSYAGIFLSVPFMAGMTGALMFGSIRAAVAGLILGALFCFALYYVPAMMGLRTGMPLYVVGSSTFGTNGAILMPGLLMGVLQIGWHAVFTFTAASFFIQAIGSDAGPNTPLFWVFCVIWGMALAFVGAVGIQWLGWLSSWIPVFPLAMIIIAAISNWSGLNTFHERTNEIVSKLPGLAPMIPLLGVAAFSSMQAAAGFFATAGAAGADFATNSRDRKDVVLGGFVGITLTAIVAGFFSIILMAGAIGKNPEITSLAPGGFDIFIASISEVGGWLANIMFWIFLAACICPTGFCAFLAGNAFTTMFPKLPRIPLTLAAGVVGILLAGTGKAANLVGFFLIIGASFGPIIGAMTADYLRFGAWPGPRKGINWAGYLAWAVGFAVGIMNIIPGIRIAYGLETLMSFIVGFTVYLILSEIGLEPPTVSMDANDGPAATE